MTTTATGQLSADYRDRAVAALRETPASPLDVLVIGGGVTGAGVALDAVTRGLRTAVVEAQDWASGTSSRSSKLVHGGLRYLQMLDFHLVHEALTERDLLIDYLAPHLVKPVSFLYPLQHRVWQRAYVGAGVAMYDVLASLAPGDRAMPWHRHVSRHGVERLFPDFRHDAAIGAVKYWDGAVDDARLVITLVRTAASYGAHAVSRMQVVDLTTSGSRVDGAVVRDLLTGEEFVVKAHHVISATGVWTEQTEALAEGQGGLRVLASKGIHIVVPRERIQGECGLILQTEKSVLFVIPWSRYWVIGTTDTAWHEHVQYPAATAADVDYVLDHANEVLVKPLTRSDIIGTWAGLRPLLQPGTKEGTSSAKVSREHTVASPRPGLTAIAGGKLTTYRVMAEDAVDFALGHQAQRNPSVTRKTQLLGAAGLEAQRNWLKTPADRFGWDLAVTEHLLHRYGSLVTDIVAMCEEDATLAARLQHAPAYLRAEIAYAARYESTVHLEDVLAHRTRIIYEYADQGVAALPEIAEILAAELGWDHPRKTEEIEAYRAQCQARDAALAESTDAAAVAQLMSAPQLSPLVEPRK